MKITNILENKIIFDNGNTLSDYHERDCCETVYADFKNVQVLTKLGVNQVNSDDLEFDEDLLNYIEKLDSIGFTIETINGIKLFVSCYNRQNGYYSNNLKLKYTIAHPEVQELDITSCTKNEYRP